MWCSSNAGRAVGYNGVTVLTAEGKLIGRIRLLVVTANVCFEYLQSRDVPNVFVVGASAFPQISSFNPDRNCQRASLPYCRCDRAQVPQNPGPLT